MLKYNFASRFFFAGIGFGIVLALPVITNPETASLFYTMIMALNLFSGWFSLSFRQRLYVDFQEADLQKLPKPKLVANIAAKGVTFGILGVTAFIVPHVVPDMDQLQFPFFLGILSAYFISFSNVSLWYSGRLYLSYAIDSVPTIILFLSILLFGSAGFSYGFVLILIISLSTFLVVGCDRWICTSRSTSTIAAKILSQLIAIASFAEVIFFSRIEFASDIVAYRIMLSLVALLSIILSVFRQWEIFNNTIVQSRRQSQLIIFAIILVMIFACASFLVIPSMLFVLLLVAVVIQLFAARDQFLVIQGNRSGVLAVCYSIVLIVIFGAAHLIVISDIFSLLFFKVMLIGGTALVPSCIALLIRLR